MKRILLLIHDEQSRYNLSKWLTQYQLLLLQNINNLKIEGQELLKQNFDFCFVDSIAIQELHRQIIEKRKSLAPLFLPFVLLNYSQEEYDIDTLGSLIDDIVDIPLKKNELELKLRVLLQSRSISLELQTAKKELSRTLARERQSNKLKSEFVSMVSHEFRNPLNSISGMAQLLQTYGDRLTPEKKADVLANLRRNITKMNDLLNDVLVISRLDMSKLQFNPAPIELETFCRNIIDQVESSFDNKQSINFIFHSSIKEVNIDRILIHHVLTSVFSNACKYSSKHSIIDFEVKGLASEIIFKISDRGIGIPPAEISLIFNAFYRASNSETYRGNGLGLTIAKQYANLHKGKVFVDSQLNVGTTFTIVINI